MQPNPPKSSRKATSRPPHAKTHSTPAPNSSTNQTRHAFFSSLLDLSDLARLIDGCVFNVGQGAAALGQN